MPRGGPRPNSGPPLGNLNAYKHGRTSKQQQRLLQLIAEDPKARLLMLQIARCQKQQRRKAERVANALLAEIAQRLQDLIDDAATARYENEQRILPLPDSFCPPSEDEI